MLALVNSARDLIIAALPTLVLFTLLSIYLKHLFFKPLGKALAERRSATEGTQHAAQNAFEKVKHKAAEYEAAFRDARGELYKEQETFRTELRAQQTSSLNEMRVKNDALLKQASARIAGETAAAQASIGTEAVLKGRVN